MDGKPPSFAAPSFFLLLAWGGGPRPQPLCSALGGMLRTGETEARGDTTHPGGPVVSTTPDWKKCSWLHDTKVRFSKFLFANVHESGAALGELGRARVPHGDTRDIGGPFCLRCRARRGQGWWLLWDPPGDFPASPRFLPLVGFVIACQVSASFEE